MNLRQAIVFAILMENNEGIVGKARSYIEEKMRSVEMMEYPERLLDGGNLNKFKYWQKRWGIKMEIDTEEIIKEDWEKEEWNGWKIVSKMLDNPDDKTGIYKTSQCYRELYEFVVAQKKKARQSAIKECIEEIGWRIKDARAVKRFNQKLQEAKQKLTNLLKCQKK